MKNQIVKNALILTAITLVSGLLLGLVYGITKEPIAQAKEREKQEAYQAVMKDASFEEFADGQALLDTQTEALQEEGLENQRIEEVMRALDGDGNLAGVVMKVTTPEGYGGDITFALGISIDGTLTGVEILTISETAGLGMKATEEEFRGQFAGKTAATLSLQKGIKAAEAEDGTFAAISGATITSTAMQNGINAAICFYHSMVEGGVLDE